MTALSGFLPSFKAAGITAEVHNEKLQVKTGVVSGNLFVLAASTELPYDATQIIAGCPAIVNHVTTQHFYRSSQSEASRTLTGAVILHGDGGQVTTYPTDGYTRVQGSLKQIPVLEWSDHCRLIEIIRMSEPVDPPTVPDLPAVTDENLELIYDTMNPTEDNAAQVFEARFRDELRYCQAWGQWLKWNTAKWETEHTLLAFHYCREIARRVNRTKGASSPAKASFARGVEAFARSSRTFATTSGEWDKSHWLVNTPTGTFDLKSQTLRPHTKSDHITKCTHVSPMEGPHPIFDRFMRDITLEDMSLVEYLQRALGACLSGAMSDNFLLFLYGTGQNGKSVLAELIAWILGDYSTRLTSETLMSPRTGNPQHLTFLVDLRGARLALASEVEEGSYFNEQRIKQLTGDEIIKANRMRQDPIEFRRTHKILILGNHRPMLRVIDPAITARLHVVPFKAHFPPEARDPDMRKKLESEAPAIFQWLIEGHQRWMEDGYLKKCSAVAAETQSYFDAQSTNDSWLDECCNVHADGRAKSNDLYKSFKAFKEQRGEGVPSQTRWGEWMSQRFLKVKSSGMCYVGVELKAEQTQFDAYRRDYD